ncbi:MAG: hypothetical protein H6661_04365 [Ardenticatenaceae bacterium]|nr:hypothetical protein [Ardenticatenaceae bacterium]
MQSYVGDVAPFTSSARPGQVTEYAGRWRLSGALVGWRFQAQGLVGSFLAGRLSLAAAASSGTFAPRRSRTNREGVGWHERCKSANFHPVIWLAFVYITSAYRRQRNLYSSWRRLMETSFTYRYGSAGLA